MWLSEQTHPGFFPPRAWGVKIILLEKSYSIVRISDMNHKVRIVIIWDKHKVIKFSSAIAPIGRLRG